MRPVLTLIFNLVLLAAYVVGAGLLIRGAVYFIVRQ